MLPRLPILVTLLSAYGAVFGNLGTLIKAFFVPAVIMLALAVIGAEFEGSVVARVLIGIAGLPFATLMAVAVHRSVLLGPDSLVNGWSLYWSERETSFLTWLVILGIWLSITVFAFSVAALMLQESWLISLAVYVFYLWVQGRFSMVLPATAVDRRMHLSQSWYLTSGNDLQLIVVLGFPILVMVGLFRLIFMLHSAYGYVILAYAVSLFTMAVEVAVLSLSYRFLFEEAREG